ncbi:uncharacterized protein LOC111800673 [Cucurbita pepo subsp. pepo]|uniref:uncharacterized protein LOC111800673 n=1 Tax=Cucurbita pepo subsp. pepo TaxID=3664 RepID=UPI000C9D9032|nr:uncharacterized protein LOC111800673 [Cucurbita pepo subsp. pepo]
MFNWVHSNFHYTPLKASRKKSESITKEAKRQGLAKQVDEMVDILDDWRINGRRLTIFFMGFDKSSKSTNYKPQYFNLKEGKRDKIVDDDDDDDDNDDLSPLMATTFPNNFDDNGEFCTQFDKSRVVVAIERHVARLRRRVTLADLLMADADGKPKLDLKENLPEVETADGSYFAKKPEMEAAPPETNLRKLMRKMTRRKIHTELDNDQMLGEKKMNHRSQTKWNGL